MESELQTVAEDGDRLVRRHAEKMQQLAALDAARQAQAEKRRVETEIRSDPTESVSAFWFRFNTERQGIEDCIRSLQPAKISTAKDLDSMANDIAALEQSVANASYFLPAYDVRSCQGSVGKLKEDLETARIALLPKRKFSFSGRQQKNGPLKEVKGDKVQLRNRPGGPDLSQRMTAGKVGGRVLHEAGGGVQAQSRVPSVDDLIDRRGGQDKSEQRAARQAEGQSAVEGEIITASPDTSGPEDPIAGQSNYGPLVAGTLKPEPSFSPQQAGGVAIEDRANAVIIVSANELEGNEVKLQQLRNCEVYLLGTIPALFVHGLTNCRVYSGPILGAAHIEEIKNSIFMLASHQIRIHSTISSDFYLRVRSKPIVEDTKAVRFAPFLFQYDGIQRDLQGANLAEENGMWEKVDDFRWLRATPSPNWSLLPAGEWLPAVKDTGVRNGQLEPVA